MRELPILFKGEMIRAILDDRKRQTRRVMRPQPEPKGSSIEYPDDGYYAWCDIEDIERILCKDPKSHWHMEKCPYGRPGDHLYVKETWAAIWPDVDPVPLEECKIEYRADTADPYPGGWPEEEARGNDEAPRWRSSLFMPKWAARLWLLNKRVRVERVQDISEEDAIAEGVGGLPDNRLRLPHNRLYECYTPKEKGDYSHRAMLTAVSSFKTLWDSINARPRPIYRTIDGRKTITHYESFPWQEGTYTSEYRGLAHHVYGNPFVWVVDFERIER